MTVTTPDGTRVAVSPPLGMIGSLSPDEARQLGEALTACADDATREPVTPHAMPP